MSKIGSNSNHAVEFAQKLGLPHLDVCRCFLQDDVWTGPNFDKVRQAAARGEMPLVSIKPNTAWAAVAAGQETVRIRDIAMGLASLGVPTAFAINHEPENDGGIQADFVKMQKYFINLVNPILHPSGGKSAIVLMGEAFRAGTAGAWVGDARPDILGSDTYMWRGANQGYAPWANPSEPDVNVPTMPYYKHLDFCKANGFIPQLWEYGVARTQADTAGTKRAACIEKFNADPRIKVEYDAIAYFELNASEAGAVINWDIRNEGSINSFKKLRTAASPPGETDAQKIARLEAEVVRLNNLLTASTGTINTITAERNAALAQVQNLQVTIDGLNTKIVNAKAALA